MRTGPARRPAYLTAMSRTVKTILLLLLALNTSWFFVYSVNLGLRGVFSDNPGTVSRVFVADMAMANAAIAAHMIAGGVLTIAAPLQALPILRRRWPHLHRRIGYTLFTLAIITGVGGFAYILGRGTIGGWWMSLWFAIYGAAILLAATKTVLAARQSDYGAHFAWATRFIILAVGSWIYRMHYGLWYLIADGAGSNETFTGPFDLIQVVAFFVPYLLVAELLLRRHTRRQAPA